MRAQSQEHHTISHLEERGVERGSARRTLELFQRQRWGNFGETGWRAYGLFQGHRYHLEPNLTVLTFKASGIGFVQYFNEY